MWPNLMHAHFNYTVRAIILSIRLMLWRLFESNYYYSYKLVTKLLSGDREH